MGDLPGSAVLSRLALAYAFAAAALRYWLLVFPLVCLHIARWRRRAQRIPDAQLRALALATLGEKRANIEGAAAFAALTPLRRLGAVTHATSAFQAAYNLLDMLGEQPSPDPVADGQRLHEALLYALDTQAAPQDWYEFHPRGDDHGYLRALLEECRESISQLSSYAMVVPSALEAARRIVAFQSLNLSTSQGDHTGLEQWATDATPPSSGLRWWETAAAAGSSLGVHVLIAAAARPGLSTQEIRALDEAYFPWVGGLHSLLDNLIDKHEDEAAGHRSLVEYYGPERAAQRMSWLAQRASAAARSLPRARQHELILTAMIANYLSSPQARQPPLEPISAAVLATTGPLRGPAMFVFKLRNVKLSVHGRWRASVLARRGDGFQ